MSGLVGQELGRYRLIEQLGEGGMASVYKAYDERLDRYVAIKVIKGDQQDSDGFVKRFEREAKALAKLSHTNIVKIHDYGEDKGILYLVMEYVSGGTMKVKMGKPLHFTEAAALIAPIARALAYAHSQNIIHRDIKPANILIDSSGHPTLSDFGISKILSQEGVTELTGTGVGIGTPDYMSPEQGQGLKIDFRTDMYSLGIVFYELLTGKKPFKADTPMAVIVKHITQPLPRPRNFIPDLPEEVERVVFKALAKKPEDRYQDMTAFAIALEQIARGGVIPLGRIPETITEDEKRNLTEITSAGTVVAGPIHQTEVTGVEKTPFVTGNGMSRPIENPAGVLSGIEKKPISTKDHPITREKNKNPVMRFFLSLGKYFLLVILPVLLAIGLVLSIIIIALAAVLSQGTKAALASSEYFTFKQAEVQTLTEDEVNQMAKDTIEPYSAWVTSAKIDLQAPDTVILKAETNYGDLSLKLKIKQGDRSLKYQLTSINDFPLFIIGGILSDGINQGFEQSIQKNNLSVKLTKFTDNLIEYEVSPLK